MCGCTILEEEQVKAVHKVLEVNIDTLSECENRGCGKGCHG